MRKDTEVLLCVDLSNVVYKSCAVHPTLSSNGIFTGGLYGFIGAVAKAINECNATVVVLCTDTKPYKRSEVYPEYKALRADTKDQDLVDKANITMRLVRELVGVTEWPLWSIQGFESDDLVAFATIQYRNRYKYIVAMSNDSDLYQLFEWPHFLLYKGKKGIYTHDDYMREWGPPAKQLILALAMTGTHNEVEGVYGIGQVTARKLLVKEPSKYRLVRQQHLKVIERNESIIKLPHPDFPVDARMPLPTGRYIERSFIRFCAKYDIQAQRWISEAFERIKGK